MNKLKTAIVIPAYNENSTISTVVKKAKKYGDVIVVDDGSSDNTEKLAEKSGAFVLSTVKNSGKGNALRKGCDYASKKYEIIIAMDADGQHDAEDIPLFIEHLNEFDYDLVLGYRKEQGMYFYYKIGNYILNLAFAILYGRRIKDTQSGFRAFKSKIYPLIRWNAQKYDIENEMLVRMLKNKIKYAQISIISIHHSELKRKGTNLKDAVRLFFNLLKWRVFGLGENEQ